MGFRINSSRRAIAIWSTVAAFLGLAILQPSAYGLEFPATTSLTLPAANEVDALTGEVYLTAKADPESLTPSIHCGGVTNIKRGLPAG